MTHDSTPRLERLSTLLNPEQLNVVTAPDGPLLVIAGAGSGKTRAVTFRVAHLLNRGVQPEEIVLLTFTNKASREMLGRVEQLVASSAGRIWGGTFHRIANLLLRRYADRIGRSGKYSILDREDSKDILEMAVREVDGPPGSRRLPKADVVLAAYSYTANTRRELGDVLSERWPQLGELTELVAAAIARYHELKRERDSMDYDDLLVSLVDLLTEHKDIRDLTARRFRHVLVDEYQDTNRLQADMVDLLSSAHGNIVAVGDDAQSIYAFRGADASNIMEFMTRYPRAQLARLETNYRSTPNILDLANAAIVMNLRQHPKTLRPVRPAGSQPALVVVRDPAQQASFIANRVTDFVQQGRRPNEIAVLYRSHFHSLELQLELSRQHIPYEVRSGIRFFESAHVKDVIAHLLLIMNPLDELAWRRVLKLLPRVGDRTALKLYRRIVSLTDPLRAIRDGVIDKAVPRVALEPWRDLQSLLTDLSSEELRASPAEMIRRVLMSRYTAHLYDSYENADTRIEDLNQLSVFALSFDDLATFLSELALADSEEDPKNSRQNQPRLILSTIHQAKGLEWSVVFVPWLIESRFPSTRSLREADGEDEERRLFYVAVTRCKDDLYLCYPEVTLDEYRHEQMSHPSRFLLELPTATYERWNVHQGHRQQSDESSQITMSDEYFNDMPYPDDGFGA